MLVVELLKSLQDLPRRRHEGASFDEDIRQACLKFKITGGASGSTETECCRRPQVVGSKRVWCGIGEDHFCGAERRHRRELDQSIL